MTVGAATILVLLIAFVFVHFKLCLISILAHLTFFCSEFSNSFASVDFCHTVSTGSDAYGTGVTRLKELGHLGLG